MDVEQFRRAEALFEAALALPEAERLRHVEQECGDDDNLRRRVLRMLELDDRELICDDLEAASARTTHAPDQTAASEEDLVGRRVGPYKLLRRLGEGGFGVVYMAEQSEPVRRLVALKLIKLGMDTKQVIARFEAERQALALMDHPNIARVYDAGTSPNGRPYFVMELVRGVPVTEFCDANSLSTHERLALFMEVCQAIQHAHQKGIIHRDLKPTNVLVTLHDGRAVPKIIDFGIAKAVHGRLTERTLYTELRQLVGTPQYMSPEQADVSGLDIDTRSDVYALGVLLYELLTGTTPFDVKMLDSAERQDLVRVIREVEPVRPSTRIGSLGEQSEDIARLRGTDPVTLQRALRHDLDWIVLKCLEKDRSRRYGTAAELRNDIGRYLRNEPVLARSPGLTYLVSKFFRRHRVSVAAGLLVAVSLVIGLVLAVGGLRQASAQRDIAQDALDTAEQRLWESYLAQARAGRNSDLPGRRFNSLEVLARAAEIREADVLRNEAIACLGLSDMRAIKSISISGRDSASGLRSPDRVAYTPRPGEVRVVSMETGEEMHRLYGPDMPVWMMQFSGDGRYLAVKAHPEDSDEGSVIVWDLSRPKPVFELAAANLRWCAFAFDRDQPTPEWVAVSHRDGTIEIRSLIDGTLIRSLQASPGVLRMAVDPTRDRLIASIYEQSVIQVWDVANGVLDMEFKTESPIRGVAVSHDGEFIAGAGNDQRVHVWNASTGETRHLLRGHQGAVVQVAFGLQPGTLVSWGWDNTTRLWDARRGVAVLAPFRNEEMIGCDQALLTKHADTVTMWRYEPAPILSDIYCKQTFGVDSIVRLGADGSLVLTNGINGVRLWDARTPRELAVLAQAEARDVFLTPQSDAVLVLGADGLYRWPVQWDGETLTLGARQPLWTGPINGTAGMSRDGRFLVWHDGEGTVTRFDLSSMSVVWTRDAPGRRHDQVTISEDGRWLFTGTWKGEFGAVVDAESGEVVLRCEGQHVMGAFSPDGEVFVFSTGDQFQFYEVGTWRLLHRVLRDNTDELAGPLDFHRDSSVVALGHSRFDIHLVEVATGRILAALGMPDDLGASSFTFSADGRSLAAIARDNRVIVWDLERIRDELAALSLEWQVRE